MSSTNALLAGYTFRLQRAFPGKFVRVFRQAEPEAGWVYTIEDDDRLLGKGVWRYEDGPDLDVIREDMRIREEAGDRLESMTLVHHDE